MQDRDRQQVERDRADRQRIEQAAAALRSRAIQDAYAGGTSKHLAFALALILDELARHVRDLRPEVRAQTLCGVRTLLDEIPL